MFNRTNTSFENVCPSLYFFFSHFTFVLKFH